MLVLQVILLTPAFLTTSILLPLRIVLKCLTEVIPAIFALIWWKICMLPEIIWSPNISQAVTLTSVKSAKSICQQEKLIPVIRADACENMRNEIFSSCTLLCWLIGLKRISKDSCSIYSYLDWVYAKSHKKDMNLFFTQTNYFLNHKLAQADIWAPL